MKYDFVIIGGGIIGVSTAWQLKKRFKDYRVLLVEKEAKIASHQTGNNSGVIHAGVYYEPGSLKAKLCRLGNIETIRFCNKNSIAYEQCGKLIVATNKTECNRMNKLLARCRKNLIDVEWLDRSQLNKIEPNICGLGAILVKNTGIVDYEAVTLKMASLFVKKGGEIKKGDRVLKIDEMNDSVVVNTSNGTYKTRYVIACAGLMADRIVKMLGITPKFQIVPFRGEYYQLSPQKKGIVKKLIYPVPDPALPFLGVHLTKMIDGVVAVGPNAVIGLKREGYTKKDFCLRDLKEIITYNGFWKLLKKNCKPGFNELKNSIFKRGYLNEIRKYCPSLRLDDLSPYPAGVRAQAVSKNGNLIHDFLFVNTNRTFHVCNAPSPAATSSIPIGSYIVDKVTNIYQLNEV